MRICFKNLKQCQFSIEEKANTAFVFMPFRKEFDHVYIVGIKETLEDLGWSCSRSDERFDAPEVICTICKGAQEATLIIADLTGRNPNVFLEVGLALGLEKYVALLSQVSEDIPFDTKTFRTILYDSQDIQDLKVKIRELVKGIEISPRMRMESAFESRYAERKRIKEAPAQPLMEIFIGSTSVSQEWLPATRENLDLMRCIPQVFGFNSDDVVMRRGFFEFQNESPMFSARVDSAGFFYLQNPIVSDPDYTNRYYVDWIAQSIAEALFFVTRVMKKKGVRTEQTLRIDLEGIRGLEVDLSRHTIPHRGGAFSKQQDTVSYQKPFNPNEKWSSFFDLICEIYRDICLDLGLFYIDDEHVKKTVKTVITSMDTLRTPYSPSRLEAVPLKEVFGESQ